MKFYNLQAEQLLSEKVKLIALEAHRWRAIHLRFNDGHNEDSDSAHRQVVTNILRESLGCEEGSIYLCSNGEVCILFQGKVSDILNSLSAQFKDFKECWQDATQEGVLYTVMDLGIHWQEFNTLCARQMHVIAQQQADLHKTEILPVYKPLRALDEALFLNACSKRASRKKLTVLVVEDDPFTRRLVNGTLKGEFDVLEAGSGEEAIAAYETNAPDAVFLDIELPDTNGHAILHALLGCDKSAFVVMLSANSVKENIIAALEKGAQGFATKPFAKEKLTHYLHLCETMRRGAHTGSTFHA